MQSATFAGGNAVTRVIATMDSPFGTGTEMSFASADTGDCLGHPS